MEPDKRYELYFDALLDGLTPRRTAALEALLAEDTSARTEWEELCSIWNDFGRALALPQRKEIDSRTNTESDGAPELTSANSFLATDQLVLPRKRTRLPGTWRSQTMIVVAACSLAFALGLWVGSPRSDGMDPAHSSLMGQPRYALLLYSNTGADADRGIGANSDSPRDHMTSNEQNRALDREIEFSPVAPPNTMLPDPVVAEMHAWAESLRAEKRSVLSEKLSVRPGADLLGTGGAIEIRDEITEPGSMRLGGIFVIRAQDLDEATSIARKCPLLQYGGLVRVRPFEDVSTMF